MSITSGLYNTANKLFEKFTYLPLSPENFWVAANTTLHRRLIALSGDQHPSSAPYLSGDTFAHFADHTLNDGQLVLNTQKIQKGEVVYVNVHLLHYFFRCIHPQISVPYVLLTHNGDRHIDVPFLEYLDDKIIHWYAQNVVIKHPKISAIPIGLENRLYYNHGAPHFFDYFQQQKVHKKTRILMDFSIHTNAFVRQAVFNRFAHHPLVDILKSRFAAKRYLSTLNEHQFVLSPPGNGLDCHRTWEAMYLKTVPIVLSSVTTEYFKKLGAPLVVVKKWSEIEKLSEAQLQKLYRETQKNANRDLLYMPYWEKKIRSV